VAPALMGVSILTTAVRFYAKSIGREYSYVLLSSAILYITSRYTKGGLLSPVLANLFLYYALDRWLTVNHKDIPFCRYADDGILHCRSEDEAHYLRDRLALRLCDCGLEMHPTKTRGVYCKDSRRTETHEQIQFDFFGYTFLPRRTVSRNGRPLLGFTPAVSR